MNTIVLNNVSVYTTPQQIADLMNDEGILIASNIVDFLNNSYSKTVVIQVHCWQDTEQAYYIIKNLHYNGETNIETKDGLFIAKTAEQEEIMINVPEQEIEPDPKCEELDAYLEQMREEDEAIWMHKYEKVSSDDEMNRDESYLYLDLRDLIGEELRGEELRGEELRGEELRGEELAQ
jgi:hypothetical protein